MQDLMVRNYLQSGLDAGYSRFIIEALYSAGVEHFACLGEDQIPSVVTYIVSQFKLNEKAFTKSHRDQQIGMMERHWIQSIADKRIENSFFRTRNTLGVAQPSVRSGDEIWFLHRASTPVILRPLTTGKYRFMGEAYVHGVMFGEAGANCTTHERISII